MTMAKKAGRLKVAEYGRRESWRIFGYDDVTKAMEGSENPWQGDQHLKQQGRANSAMRMTLPFPDGNSLKGWRLVKCERKRLNLQYTTSV